MARNVLTIGFAVEPESEAGIGAKVVKLNILIMAGRVGNAGGDFCMARLSRHRGGEGHVIADGISSAVEVGRGKRCEIDVGGVLSESAGAQGCENDSVGVHLTNSRGY